MFSVAKLQPASIILNIWRLLQVCNFTLVNQIVGNPYMDEVFHVPQAQQYCMGNFRGYDAKLTTPPGLYLISVSLHALGLPCSIVALRAVNLFIGLFFLPDICSRIGKALHPDASIKELAWYKCLPIMPLLSFFSLLYYTDLASTYLVLLSYYCLLRNRRWTAAIVSFCSLWLRQTNIVWIAAFVGLHLLKNLEATIRDGTTEQSWKDVSISGLTQRLIQIAKLVLVEHHVVLRVALPFLPLFFFSIGFIFFNGSIVLGDKTMHQAGFYPIQLGYMITFSVAMSAVTFLRIKFLARMIAMRRHLMIVVICTACCIAVSKQKKFQHPFLLADNRHYTFYINKRLLQPISHPAFGLLLALCSGLFSMRIGMVKSTKVIIMAAAAILALCPSPLLEFRYYIIPFLLWRLHEPITIEDEYILAAETCSWLVLHMLTVWLFLFKGFKWTDDNSIQRFMW